MGAHARSMHAPVRRPPDHLGGARAVSTAHRRGEERTELTDRESDVSRLLDEGPPKRDIPQEVAPSFEANHFHTESIYIRLNVSIRGAAIERAHGLELL
jgi:ATP/maltotriose-dependent transcriptional regulator MalT